MFGNFIRSITLTILVSFAIFSSYAAESSTQSNKSKVNSAIQQMTDASQLYIHACNLAQLDSPSKEKANQAFLKVIEITRAALVDMPLNTSDVYKTCVQLQAISQRQLGSLRYNMAMQGLGDPKKVSESFLNLVRAAIQHVEESYNLYFSIKDQQNVVITSQSLVPALEAFATLCALRAEIETKPSVSVALYEECIASKERSCSLLSGQLENVSLSHYQTLAVHKMLNFYNVIGGIFDDLCSRLKQKDHSVPANYTFKMCSSDTSNLVKFWEKRIVGGKVNCTIFPPQLSVKQTQRTGRKQNTAAGVVDVTSPFFDLLKALPPVLDAEDFLDRIRTFQCGILWGVYQEDLNNGISRKVASAAYKKYVYQGEFANDLPMEEAFIFAHLEDLIGNPHPLNNFYKELHAKRKQARHQKMVEAIKADLLARQIENERQAAIAEERLQLESRPRTVPFSTISSPSYEYSPSELPKPEILAPKVKEKRRGVASVPDSQEIKSGTKEESISSKEATLVRLSGVEFEIYQKINANGKITIKEVIVILTAFNCRIEDGAKHKKATAQNGKVWTIPDHSQREGPIDPAYRRSLRNFLHITLEIDPEDVVLKT
jgi:hypothetical protein